MMSIAKKILLALSVVFVAVQFIRPAHNSSNTIQTADMVTQFKTPANVAGIIKTSCYDCHSNNTGYPWYVNIQPMGWLMANHIKDGKANLNFSEFGTYSKRKQANKLRAIATSMKEGSMPLSSYTIMHTDAKLSSGDKTLIILWATKTRDSLSLIK